MKTLKILFVVALFSLQLFALEIKSDADAVMAMGKGMSGMRNMLEMYAMVGMKIKYKNPKERLKAIIEDYKNTLSAISEKYKNNADIMNSVSRGSKAWAPIEEAFLHMDPSKADEMKKNALFVHAHMRSVIKEMEFIKDYLTKNSNMKNVKELNAAIEIAASSQRLSSHYMMKVWKLDDPTIKEHWDKGVKKYKDAVKLLLTSSFASNTEFKKLLDDSGKLLQFFEMIFDNDNAVPALIDKRANRAYNDAEKMVKIILMQKK